MREFNTETIKAVPEEIMLTDPEVTQLMGMEPADGIKMAFAAGAHAMEELDAQELDEAAEIASRHLEDIRLRIMQSRDLLDGVRISAFDTTENVVDIEAAQSAAQYLRKATAWAEQNYKLISSALSLVSDSLDKLSDELEDYT